MIHITTDTSFGYTIYKEENGSGIYNLNPYRNGLITQMFIDYDTRKPPIPMHGYPLIDGLEIEFLPSTLYNYTFYEERDIEVKAQDGSFGNSKNNPYIGYNRKCIREIKYCIPLTTFERSR